LHSITVCNSFDFYPAKLFLSNTINYYKMKKLLPGVILLISFFYSHAQWDSNPATANTPFCTDETEQQEKIMIGDGANGAILFIRSVDGINLTFSNRLHAQRIDANGNIVWGAANLPKIIYSTDDQAEFNVLADAVADGSGGAYLAWLNNIDTFYNYFMQHIDGAGNLLWASAGIKINADNGRQAGSLKLSADGTGGVVAVWDESIDNAAKTLTLYSQIFAQRYSSAGAKQWGAGGVQVCTNSGLRGAGSLMNDGAGGFVIYFGDTRNSTQLPGYIFNNIDIYAQRLNANGTLAWAAAGAPVVTAPLNQVPSGGFGSAGNTVADGSGGSIILFDEYTLDSDNNKYKVQKLNTSGTVQWAPAGVSFCIADSTRFLIKAVTDGAGGIVAAWSDFRSFGTGGQGTYTQRVLANGTANWTSNGIKLISTGFIIYLPGIIMWMGKYEHKK
jgi:hypothetical protein